MSLQYLNKRAHLCLIAIVSMMAFLGGVATSISPTVSAAAAPVAVAQTTTTSSAQVLTSAELVDAINRSRGYHPTMGLTFHGRSRGSLAQAGPQGGLTTRPTMILPGTKRLPLVLTFKQTQKVKKMVTEYAARGGLLTSAATAALCAVLFIEATPIVSAIAGATCGVLMGWYWADIQDAMSKVPVQDVKKTPAKSMKCFVVTVNSWASFQWLTFSSGTCPKGKRK